METFNKSDVRHVSVYPSSFSLIRTCIILKLYYCLSCHVNFSHQRLPNDTLHTERMVRRTDSLRHPPPR